MQPEEVSYVVGTVNDQQKLDLYLPSTKKSERLVVFIHGGAWRTGSRKDHQDLATYLCDRGLAVAVIDYRLSTKADSDAHSTNVHPVHCNDVISALGYLRHRARSACDIPTHYWTVVGHSVGAWLALSGLFVGSRNQAPAKYPERMPKPPQTVLHSISTCILVDGIYSITDLLKEYPDYTSFVAQAFLPHAAAADYSHVSLDDWLIETTRKMFYVWHSRDDELLSFRQSVGAVSLLQKLLPASQDSVKVEVPADGVAATSKSQGKPTLIRDLYPNLVINTPSQLIADFSSLRQGHDELLHTSAFFQQVFEAAQSTTT